MQKNTFPIHTYILIDLYTFSLLQLSGDLLALAGKGWVLMNYQVLGVSRLGPSLANQNVLHG